MASDPPVVLLLRNAEVKGRTKADPKMPGEPENAWRLTMGGPKIGQKMPFPLTLRSLLATGDTLKASRTSLLVLA